MNSGWNERWSAQPSSNRRSSVFPLFFRAVSKSHSSVFEILRVQSGLRFWAIWKAFWEIFQELFSLQSVFRWVWMPFGGRFLTNSHLFFKEARFCSVLFGQFVTKAWLVERCTPGLFFCKIFPSTMINWSSHSFWQQACFGENMGSLSKVWRCRVNTVSSSVRRCGICRSAF